jgi:hypothetical protein
MRELNSFIHSFHSFGNQSATGPDGCVPLGRAHFTSIYMRIPRVSENKICTEDVSRWDEHISRPSICVYLGFPKNKICTENNELIYMGVFPRLCASPRAARAPARCGVDQTFDPARFRLGWNRTVLSEPRRVRPLQGEGHANSWSRIGRV